MIRWKGFIVTVFFVVGIFIQSGFTQRMKHLTFHIDMHDLGIDLQDTTLNVGIRGTTPLSWVSGVKLKDMDGDGIYSTIIDIDLAQELDSLIFKCVLNEVEWEGGEVWRIGLQAEAPEIFEGSFRYIKRPENPFRSFVGEWTLKDDLWWQGNESQKNEPIKIPGHYSICKAINTENSLQWEVDATSARGHILWVYNTEKQEVNHLSSFFPNRSGVGKGKVNERGDVTLKVAFEGEGVGTYRLYTYQWISADEYTLKSVLYKDGISTGDFYGGTFIRIK